MSALIVYAVFSFVIWIAFYGMDYWWTFFVFVFALLSLGWLFEKLTHRKIKTELDHDQINKLIDDDPAIFISSLVTVKEYFDSYTDETEMTEKELDASNLILTNAEKNSSRTVTAVNLILEKHLKLEHKIDQQWLDNLKAYHFAEVFQRNMKQHKSQMKEMLEDRLLNSTSSKDHKKLSELIRKHLN